MGGKLLFNTPDGLSIGKMANFVVINTNQHK